MQHLRPSAPCPDSAPDRIAAHGLDGLDRAVLTLQRHFFRSFAEPATQSWIQALALGDEAFPRLPRGEAAILVLTQVQALRSQRRRVFRFSNPWCPGCSESLTQDELALVRLFRAARQGSEPDLALLASDLCDAAANPALVLASLALAEALCPPAPRFH